MDLDFDKFCLVDGSPTTVLPVPRHRSVETNRNLGGERICGTDTPIEEFEIDFDGYCSGSFGDVRSRSISRESSEVLKRGSVYQSSKEVSLIQKTDPAFARKKIEFSPRAASSFSAEIIDSLCSSDEESSVFEQSRASVMSSSEQSTSSVYGNGLEFGYGDIIEEDVAVSLKKSLFALPSSPAKSEPDSSRASSPKARFSPVRKMFDPFVTSRPRRSPLSKFNEARGEVGIKPRQLEFSHRYEEKEKLDSVPHSSPAHLHGVLEMGNKNGVPFFQFSVKSPEEVYVAKTWKDEDSSTWVYTFHLLANRRKRGTKGWGFRECNQESTMVGRMHVSCRLHTEFEGAGQLNDSMVTEFVSYDILQSRKSSDELHPEVETAAIVMQSLLEKRESLKFKSGDKKIDETPTKMLDCGKMHVVIPGGNHSLPSDGSCGPSPLLDRWRFGGGCDCGGWDMACPLTIFTEAQRRTDSQHSTELFVQGRKDTIPAFTMNEIEDGKFAVDFHAQLSSLQAFSICVAILHASEASPLELERSKPMLQSEALKVYTEEEIKTMLHEIAEEEKSKIKKMEQVVPSFSLNPPFSPIARV